VPDPDKKPRRRVKKVKGHGGAHHGGAWKVAYADFVTAMMALFLVLWLVSQADTKLKSAIANYFRSPGVFDQQAGGVIDGPKRVSKDPSPLTTKDEEQALFGIATILRKKFSTRPEFANYKDQIKIEMTEQGLKIQIVDKAQQVSFSSGSAELTGEAKAILDEIAHGICSLPNPLLIGGHTDRTTFPPGSIYTNWELSADRANAARRELEANCVKPEQIRRIVGYADTEPLIADDPYAVGNRRISVTVLRMAGANGGDGVAQDDKNTSQEQIVDPKSVKPDLSKPVSAPSEPLPQVKPSEFKVPEFKAGDKKSISVGTPDEIPANLKVRKEK
jgi:chemotaxis protein MotB